MNKNSPFTDIDDAYEPMFDEHVVVTHGNQKQTLVVSVFLDNTADAILDDAMDTDREDIYIVGKKRDWGYVSKLMRGDRIQRTEVNGVRYALQEVKHDAVMGWCIHARSI